MFISTRLNASLLVPFLPRGHPFITCAEFFEKLTFLTQGVRNQGVRNVSFSENFADIPNGWSPH